MIVMDGGLLFHLNFRDERVDRIPDHYVIADASNTHTYFAPPPGKTMDDSRVKKRVHAFYMVLVYCVDV